MSLEATQDAMEDRFSGGMAGAIVLHVVFLGILVIAALYARGHRRDWGESTSSVGAIQASMVNAIPLPPKARPVEKAVLASEDVTAAPAPPPKERAAPPPKPTDILIKEKTPAKPPIKTAPTPTPEPPKHPQPTPPTPKAAVGDASPQLPQSVMQTKNGTATVTVQNRTFGERYQYYLRIVGSKVTQNYFAEDIDPRSSMNKSVTVLFDILRDGTVANVHIETPSGSTTLDAAARHAIGSIDGFGPLPEGADHITIEYKFDYHQK